MRRLRRIKILATLGPASSDSAMIGEMAFPRSSAGASFRLSFVMIGLIRVRKRLRPFAISLSFGRESRIA